MLCYAIVKVLGVVVSKLRPLSAEKGAIVPVATFDIAPHVRLVYDALLPRLEAQDLDQEIKNRTIISVGKLLFHCGDLFNGHTDTDRLLNLLHARLENEITRVSALRALTLVGQSPVNVSLVPVRVCLVFSCLVLSCLVLSCLVRGLIDYV